MNEVAAVYLVDDDASYLAATSRLLRAEGFEVTAFESALQLLQYVSPTTRGCVVADLQMPLMSGLELQAQLAQGGASLPIVFLTGRADVRSSVTAMRGGAADFLEKCATREDVVGAIRNALAREAVQHAARARLAEIERRFARLTKREREVLQYVVRGKMNKEIAAALSINERTVKLHRTAITTKVGVHSTAQLAALATEARVFASDSARPQQH